MHRVLPGIAQSEPDGSHVVSCALLAAKAIRSTTIIAALAAYIGLSAKRSTCRITVILAKDAHANRSLDQEISYTYRIRWLRLTIPLLPRYTLDSFAYLMREID